MLHRMWSAVSCLVWNDHVKHDKDQSLFWHWIWTEAARPNSGYTCIITPNYADY